MDGLLGIDVGTTGIKAILGNTEDKIIAEVSAENTLSSPKAGWAEEDANQWWSNVGQLCRHLQKQHPEVSVTAVGVSGMVPTIVLLDADSPFGNDRLLPRGSLREPLSALAAAQVLILTRFQENLHQRRLMALKATFPDKTVLTAAITPAAAHCHPGDQEQPLSALRGRHLYAFAGLARSEVFIDTLIELGVTLKGVNVFPDHYAFNRGELQALVEDAQARGSEALITTAKDWARMGETWEADLPLWVLEVEAKLHQPLPAEVMAGLF